MSSILLVCKLCKRYCPMTNETIVGENPALQVSDVCETTPYFLTHPRCAKMVLRIAKLKEMKKKNCEQFDKLNRLSDELNDKFIRICSGRYN